MIMAYQFQTVTKKIFKDTDKYILALLEEKFEKDIDNIPSLFELRSICEDMGYKSFASEIDEYINENHTSAWRAYKKASEADFSECEYPLGI